MTRWLFCLLIAMTLFRRDASAESVVGPPGGGTSRSVSRTVWLVAADTVTVRVVLPSEVAAELVGKSMPLLSNEGLANYVLSRVSVVSAGAACPAIDQGYDLGKVNSLSVGASLYGFEIVFHCPAAADKTLHFGAMFDAAPQHIDYARIDRDGRQVDQLFAAHRQDLSVPLRGELPAAGAGTWARLGASHIGTRLDVCCALLGLFVLARRRRHLLMVAVALLAGYGASVAVSADGRLVPDSAALAGGIGFLCVSVATLLVAAATKHTRVLARAVGAGFLLLSAAAWALHRPSAACISFGFGIIACVLLRTRLSADALPLILLSGMCAFFDGFVLPADYARLQVWAGTVGQAAAFNAGALGSACLLLAALAAATALARRLALRMSAALAEDLCATALAGCVTFWLLSRLY